MGLSTAPHFPEQADAWAAVSPHLPALAGWTGPAWSHRVLQPIWHLGPLRVLAGIEEREGTWLHVSVSRNDQKLPTWANLTAVRRAFFAPDACVVQVLPPVDEHFSFAEVLHLWERRGGPRLVPDLRRYDPLLGAAGV